MAMSFVARRLLLPGGAVASVYAATQKPAPPYQRAPGEASSKLSIYDPPEPAYTEVPIAPSPLELGIRHVRHTVRGALQSTAAAVHGVVDRWIAVERHVKARVTGVVHPDERLIPEALYVCVAAFTGSFLVRSRMLPVRLLVPPAFFVGAAAYLLPKTSRNIYDAAFQHLPPHAQDSLVAARLHADQLLASAHEQIGVLQAQIQSTSEALGIPIPSANKPAPVAVAAVVEPPKPTTEQVVANVEAMYTTRGPPGVKELIEEDRKTE